MTKRFALVCCGKQKSNVASPAKDMYESTLFRKTRAFVEANYAEWLILSALHHVLEPTQVIEPYDVTLRKNEADSWARQTAADLVTRIPKTHIVVYFGGALYEPVAQLLEARGYAVERPLKGLQIGERLRWLTQRLCSREFA